MVRRIPYVATRKARRDYGERTLQTRRHETKAVPGATESNEQMLLKINPISPPMSRSQNNGRVDWYEEDANDGGWGKDAVVPKEDV